MKAVAALVLLALGAAPAAAQMAACAAAGTQTEMNACADQEYRKADAALSEVYAKLKAKVTDPAGRASLAGAERAWSDYRDRECEFETSGTIGGGIRPLLLAMCRSEKTAVHAAELNRQLNCPEGDPSCTH